MLKSFQTELSVLSSKIASISAKTLNQGRLLPWNIQIIDDLLTLSYLLRVVMISARKGGRSAMQISNSSRGSRKITHTVCRARALVKIVTRLPWEEFYLICVGALRSFPLPHACHHTLCAVQIQGKKKFQCYSSKITLSSESHDLAPDMKGRGWSKSTAHHSGSIFGKTHTHNQAHSTQQHTPISCYTVKVCSLTF